MRHRGDRGALVLRLSGTGNEPVIAVDRESGAAIQQMAVRSSSGRAVSSDQLMYKPGRGATRTTRDYLLAKNRRNAEMG